jgi:hypothetical protein
VNILIWQLWTADKEWFPSLGLGEVLGTPNCKNLTMLQNSHKSLGIGMILQYNLSNGKGI